MRLVTTNKITLTDFRVDEDFGDTIFIRSLIRFEALTLRLSALGRRVSKKLLEDPTVIYNRKAYVAPRLQTDDVEVPVSESVTSHA